MGHVINKLADDVAIAVSLFGLGLLIMCLGMALREALGMRVYRRW